MIVFIQLTGVGVDSGPFNLHADANPTPFAVGISRSSLLLGTNFAIPDGSATVTVVSTGVCEDSIVITITTTTTTTAIPT